MGQVLGWSGLAYLLLLPASTLPGSSNPRRPISTPLVGVQSPALPAVVAVGAGVLAGAAGAGL